MGWIREEMARARARSEQVPPWARPVLIRQNKPTCGLCKTLAKQERETGYWYCPNPECAMYRGQR